MQWGVGGGGLRGKLCGKQFFSWLRFEPASDLSAKFSSSKTYLYAVDNGKFDVRLAVF